MSYLWSIFKFILLKFNFLEIGFRMMILYVSVLVLWMCGTLAVDSVCKLSKQAPAAVRNRLLFNWVLFIYSWTLSIITQAFIRGYDWEFDFSFFPQITCRNSILVQSSNFLLLMKFGLFNPLSFLPIPLNEPWSYLLKFHLYH